MNHATRTSLQDAFRRKFVRYPHEGVTAWKTRLAFAIADINVTLKLHPHDSTYAQRLYVELDEARVAYTLATR